MKRRTNSKVILVSCGKNKPIQTLVKMNVLRIMSLFPCPWPTVLLTLKFEEAPKLIKIKNRAKALS